MLLSEGIILSIVCLLIICLIFKKIKEHQKYPPGPWNLPIVGYLPFLGKQPQKKFMKLAEKYGNIFQIFLGNKRVVVLNGQATVREALADSKASEFASRPEFFIRKSLRPKGIGILGTQYGPDLKIRRKIVIRALTKCANRGQKVFHDTLEQAVDKLVNTFTDKAGQLYDPKDDINRAVGKVISSLCFGQDFLKYEENYYNIILNIDKITNLIGIGNILNFFPWTKPFFKKKIKEFLEVSDEFDSICSKSLQFHEESLEDDSPMDVADAIIKTIREMKKEGENVIEITRFDIIEIIRELLLAGFATVATTLRWSIYYMIAHPECQKKVQEELDASIPENEKISLSYKDKLPYMEATLLETHRFASVVASGVPRSAYKDTVFNGYYIPKDTMILPNLWSVHRDPTIWNNPDQFNPLRFLNSDHTKVQSLLAEKILPFGAGRRRCAGEILARSELFIFFGVLMKQFEFSTFPGHELNLKDFESGASFNTHSVPICIKKRKQN